MNLWQLIYEHMMYGSISKCMSCHQAICETWQGSSSSWSGIYIYIQHTLSNITIIALWQLVPLGISMYSYMLLVFEKSKSAQVNIRALSLCKYIYDKFLINKSSRHTKIYLQVVFISIFWYKSSIIRAYSRK